MNRLALSIAALLLALASEAAADGLVTSPMGDLLRAGASTSYQTVRAETRPLGRLGLFAQGRGFPLLRQGTLFDLEGGASLALLESLEVVGSYRMLGYDYGIGATSVDPQVSGAFFGLKLGF